MSMSGVLWSSGNISRSRMPPRMVSGELHGWDPSGLLVPVEMAPSKFGMSRFSVACYILVCHSIYFGEHHVQSRGIRNAMIRFETDTPILAIPDEARSLLSCVD